MEIFKRAKVVKLQSHHKKYLTAQGDGEHVLQDLDGSAQGSCWMVELADDVPNVVRLRSCHGRYLAASEKLFLLGLTGKKILQALPTHLDPSVEWEPLAEGDRVKLKSSYGNFLRANGSLPPWKNSVTHDVPQRTTFPEWVLWGVEILEFAEQKPRSWHGTPVSGGWSPLTHQSSSSPSLSTKLFQPGKLVRLRSTHGKYLTAGEDQTGVGQQRHGFSAATYWAIDVHLDNSSGTAVVRLASCYGRYLTASEDPFLLGVTGKKVLQTLPSRLNSFLEWEPIQVDAGVFKLKTSHGRFLRANSGPPPWLNSVTHDAPEYAAFPSWFLWHVEMADTLPDSPSAGGP